jgi:serine/threonine protein kinase
MAEVMIARSNGIEGFEHHVVIKRIRDEQAHDARFVQMFLDEARLAASLHHHNIVQVHDIGQDNGEYFFAMEYIHGEDLRRLLAHASDRDLLIPLDHVLTIVTNSAAALHFAHEHRGPDRKPLGLVHRDVSPANILVGYDGNVKVVDFGIAKATQQHAAHEDTRSGVMKGKVAYMSPEQCVGEAVDRRSDIYCLGIVLYELVTVRRLFKGANDFLTMSAIASGVIPRPSEFRPDIPPALEAIIMKALGYRPEDRFQTADEMRAALEQFAISAGLRGSTTALADYMREQFGDRELPWLADEDDAEVSIDFDGSGSGMAPTPEVSGFEKLSAPTSPLGKAMVRERKKADTGAPDPSGALSLDAMSSIPVDAMPFGGAHAPSVSGAIIAPTESRPRRLWIGAGIVAGLALILVVAIASSGITPPPNEAAGAVIDPEPVAPPITPPKPAPAPVATKPAAAAPTPTEVEIEPVPVAPTPAKTTVARPQPTPPPPPAKKRPPPPKPVKGSWDPDALFPKK